MLFHIKQQQIQGTAHLTLQLQTESRGNFKLTCWDEKQTFKAQLFCSICSVCSRSGVHLHIVYSQSLRMGQWTGLKPYSLRNLHIFVPRAAGMTRFSTWNKHTEPWRPKHTWQSFISAFLLTLSSTYECNETARFMCRLWVMSDKHSFPACQDATNICLKLMW